MGPPGFGTRLCTSHDSSSGERAYRCRGRDPVSMPTLVRISPPLTHLPALVWTILERLLFFLKRLTAIRRNDTRHGAGRQD
ncbi:hypothetical protein K443DRAFT_680437 [Laccaria amethystina LaAM-08-1]|uniref:Uncharacterized protein n=1 Tax=Laccaria amethystina LaAM-08-1 TaxID=1095629 RepID=A0A0C9XS70_9AGAR|nr:hypothetical protein K443DRAFT_680437 [Laccaria amethystina LaAM-08-1]